MKIREESLPPGFFGTEKYMNEKIFEFTLTLIPVLSAVITYFIVPYLKTNIDAGKLEQYKEWASLAAKTAEMLWKETGQGENKKQYVIHFLNQMFNSKKVVITEEQMNILIEAAVQQMKENGQGGIQK